jgi:hypothetical protein
MREPIDDDDRGSHAPASVRPTAVRVLVALGRGIGHVVLVIFGVFSAVLQAFTGRPMLPPDGDASRQTDYRP